MKLKKAEKNFLYETILNSFDTTIKKARGLTKEQKQLVYKEARKSLNKTLSKEYSKDEIKQINTLLREFKKNEHKKKK
jgi:uncharacterized protein YcbK (DUF882 family)